MKVALTGATGGVGRHFARAARARGDSVRALVRDTAGAADLAELGVELVAGDLADTEALGALAKGCDAFVHAAAQVGDQGTEAQFEEVNVRGTERAIEAAARGGVRRFVHVSSVAVYGRPEHGIIEETFAPLACDGPYERTKLAAERLAFARGKAHRVEVSAVRPPVIFGPYDRQFIPRVLDGLRKHRTLYIDGGRAPFNVVSADDLTEAILLCATHPSAAGEAFNVAASPPPCVRDVIDTIADAAALRRPFVSLPRSVAMPLARGVERLWAATKRTGPAPITPFVVTLLTRNVVYDAQKARRVLGWTGGRKPLDAIFATTRAHIARGA